MAAQLTEESQAFVDLVKQAGGVNLSLPLETIRKIAEEPAQRLKGDFVYSGTSTEVLVPAVDNGVEYTIPVTVLRPTVENDSWRNIMVFFHGGGWAFCSRNSHMKICEIISQASNCVVVNVGYRLSPEHKYPACYVDVEAVVRWCLSNKFELAKNNAAIVGVAGDSAGGNLAASVCHLVKGLDYQVLIYPSLTLAARKVYQSYATYKEGYLLTAELMAWFMKQFLNSEKDGEDELCSPMLRKSFEGLPPALFIVAECDPLADQSPEYQSKLENAGVRTEFVLMKGTVHGFITKPGLFKKTSADMVKNISEFLSKL